MALEKTGKLGEYAAVMLSSSAMCFP